MNVGLSQVAGTQPPAHAKERALFSDPGSWLAGGDGGRQICFLSTSPTPPVCPAPPQLQETTEKPGLSAGSLGATPALL